jgi:hypothetical protein
VFRRTDRVSIEGGDTAAVLVLGEAATALWWASTTPRPGDQQQRLQRQQGHDDRLHVRLHVPDPRRRPNRRTMRGAQELID